MEDKKPDPIAEELTLEPREPGKTTAEAFDKSMEASNAEIANIATEGTPQNITPKDLLEVLKMAPPTKANAKLLRVIKKAQKDDRKAKRPRWRR